MKILIVEDEDALAKVLVEKFQRENFEVKLAMDGVEAVSLANSFKPDIIALDIMLPKKNGVDVLREIKANPDLNTIPVIMMSNLDGDEDIKNCMALGAVDYFVKSQHLLKEIIEKVKAYSLKGR